MKLRMPGAAQSFFRRAGSGRMVWLHAVLLCLTLLTAFSVAAGEGAAGGMYYAFGLICILLSHEMGHYLTARKYGVRATLPFFIPMPLPPFGTMGALIKLRDRIPDRRALFDIGAAGPLAGLAAALPVLWAGLGMSAIVDVQAADSSMITLGDSLFFRWMTSLAGLHPADGQDILLHPLAYAGWVGLFVTALNLLPVGQLDGGHIMYAVFGKKSRAISIVYQAALAYIALFHFAGWMLPLILLFIFRRHPPPGDDLTSPGPARLIAGAAIMLLFFLVFTPVPFQPAEGLVPLILPLFR